jgi:hypothetical protein
LAQVYHVSDAGNRVVVRVVPRLDLAALAAQWSSADGKKPPSSHIIPPAKRFNADAVRAAGGTCNRDTYSVTGEVCDEFQGKYFADGLLYLELNNRQISPHNKESPMSMDELADFVNEEEDSGVITSALAEQNTRKRAVTQRTYAFAVGDYCRIVSGQDSGLEGTIDQLNLLKSTCALQTSNVVCLISI